MKKLNNVNQLIDALKSGEIKVGEDVCLVGNVSKKDFGTKKLIYTIDGFNTHITCFDANVEHKSVVKLQKPLYLEGKIGHHFGEYTIDEVKNVDSNVTKQQLLRVYEKDKTNQNLLYVTMSMHNDEKASEIVKSFDGINPNGLYNGNNAVFFAIQCGLPKTLNAIINHNDFDGKDITDGFGEPLLVALLYLYGSKDIKTLNKVVLKEMIDAVISSNKFDLNAVDINNTTALMVACEYGINFVVKALCDIPEVDVNMVDDLGMTALDAAIKANKYETIDILMSRNDLKVTNKQKRTINLHKACKHVKETVKV